MSRIPYRSQLREGIGVSPAFAVLSDLVLRVGLDDARRSLFGLAPGLVLVFPAVLGQTRFTSSGVYSRSRNLRAEGGSPDVQR